MGISWKNIENWRSWKMRFFWGGHFEFCKSAILNFFLLHLCEKSSPFIWGNNFFSQYVRTIMVTKYHFLLHLSEKSSPFIWGIIFFLHYGWFFQNLGKEAVPTFMHTTVHRTSKHYLLIYVLDFWNMYKIRQKMHDFFDVQR